MKFKVVIATSYTIEADSQEDAEAQAWRELYDEWADSGIFENVFGINSDEAPPDGEE